MHFVTFRAFLKMGCGVEMKVIRVTLATHSSTGASNSKSPQSLTVRYLTRQQFFSFFGFSDEIGKGVALFVWGDLKSILQSKKISSPRKCPWSKSASHFKGWRPKSLVFSPETPLKKDTWAAWPVLWLSRCCRGKWAVDPSLQFSLSWKWGSVCICK